MSQRVDNAHIRVRKRFRQWLRFESVRRHLSVFMLLEQLAAESEALKQVCRALDVHQVKRLDGADLSLDEAQQACAAALDNLPRPWDSERWDQEKDYGQTRFRAPGSNR